MNSLKGHIHKVKASGGLSQVTIVLAEETYLKSIVIETPETASYLNQGTPVHVVFKETEVVLAKGKTDGLSIRNRIEGKIQTLNLGDLLCDVLVSTKAGPITAIISREAMDSMELKEGDHITVMVKQNEVMLAE